MHSSVAPLKHTLDLNTRLFLNCLEGVSDEMALDRPGERTNHIAFVAMHTLDTRYYLARALGLDVECPFKGQLEGKKGLEDIEQFPSLDAVRDAWNDISRRLSNHIEGLDHEQFTEKRLYQFPIEEGGTMLGTLAFLTHHDTYHIGQLAILRRYCGLEGISYS